MMMFCSLKASQTARMQRLLQCRDTSDGLFGNEAPNQADEVDAEKFFRGVWQSRSQRSGP